MASLRLPPRGDARDVLRRRILLVVTGVLCFALGFEWSSLRAPALDVQAPLAEPPPPPADSEAAASQAEDSAAPTPPHPFQDFAPLELHFASVALKPPVPPFLYASILQDDDSFQIRNASIRALEPGLTASWLHRAGQCCAEGGTVIDVGSHFGYYALLGAAMGCKYIAVEPVPMFRAILDLNIALNPGLAPGPVLPYAIGTEGKTINMEVPRHGSFGTAHVAADDAAGDTLVSVEQRRLDDALEGVLPPDARVCMLKVDVEGREPSVIASSPKLFTGNNKPEDIMMEFSPGFTKDGLDDMLRTLYEYGYGPTAVDWGHVRIEQPVSDIDVSDWFRGVDDISTPEGRQRLIDGISININLFFWPQPPKPAA